MQLVSSLFGYRRASIKSSPTLLYASFPMLVPVDKNEINGNLPIAGAQGS